jgi:hypothetical protein
MIKCKKHGLFVTGCSRWNGSYLFEACEKCDFEGRVFESHSDTTGQGKTIRRNSSRPSKNKGNVVRTISTLKVHPFFKGGLHGKQV